MFKRVLTAVIALLLFIPIILYGSWLLELLMGVLAVLGLSEFLQMKKISVFSVPAVLSSLAVLMLAFSSRLTGVFGDNVMMTTISLLTVSLFVYSVNKPDFKITQIGSIVLMATYLGIAFTTFVSLRAYGLTFMFLVLLVIWATDTGAYLIGKQIGKTKLAPNVSPNKTVEGALGGTLLSAVVSAIYLYFFPLFTSYLLSLLFMIVISAVGQLGDLIESKIKREYGVKDSGNLLPGHGGILDRFDSLLLVLNVLFIIGLL